MLTAIFEYGIILAMKRYQYTNKPTKNRKVTEETKNKQTFAAAFKESHEQENTFDVEKISKLMDRWTMIGSLTFIICFNTIYWATLGF